MTGLAEVLSAVARVHADMTDRSSQDGCSCGYPDPRTYEDHLAAIQAAAVTAWLAERLGSEEVREAVSKYLLTEAMDGDFLVAAGRSIDNEGQDVPINKARTSEVAWWAVDAALAAVVGALAGES